MKNSFLLDELTIYEINAAAELAMAMENLLQAVSAFGSASEAAGYNFGVDFACAANVAVKGMMR